ncbi:sigma-E processing peptidase SpoIIGA [Desulfitibacter alkalitolerans]|uniref:sigma-E processing peptidase SpoIIGA n=1 Tax=Desulfitibacter alkalitolerans TaxID=264641 RepID=UPI00048737C5|nr:sigma-E processing peptidase SpoIIGA [Desulfitibacter alkalitolerans]
MLDDNILYLDVLFLVNLAMDFVLIWATAKITGFTTSFRRIFTAACTGALYSVTVYFPSLHTSFSSLLVKIAFSILMIYIAFYPLSFRKMIQALAYFYFIVFAVGGAMLAAIYLMKTENTVQAVITGKFSIIEPLGYNWLLAALVTAAIIGRFGTRLIIKNFIKSILYVPVIICLGEERVAVKTLVDTGNQLTDPITGKPVMITELDVLQGIIPKKAFEELKNNDDFDVSSVIACLSQTYLASRLRVIPFNSIGEQKGMLIGFRPDAVIIVHNHKTIKIKDIIVGIYKYKLSSKGIYKGLLHPELLRNFVSDS